MTSPTLTRRERALIRRYLETVRTYLRLAERYEECDPLVAVEHILGGRQELAPIVRALREARRRVRQKSGSARRNRTQ